MARLIVLLTGDIDALNAETACRMLDAIDGPAEIDLSGVRYLASAGLTELARVAKRGGARVVTLTKMQPQVLRVLQIVRFGELFLLDPARGKAWRPMR